MSQSQTFPGKRPDEVLVAIHRRHWSLLIGKTFRLLVVLALPVIVLFVLSAANGGFSFDSSSAVSVSLILGGSIYALVVWLVYFHDWLDFYLDAFILTNERILQIEQRGLFNRMVSSLDLDLIQDVTVETKGVLATLFSVGTITVETAGEQQNFVFKYAHHPETLQSQVLQYARIVPKRPDGQTDKPPAGSDRPRSERR